MNYFSVGFSIASLISLIFLPPPTYAQVPADVVINEFSIEPEQTVELFNMSDEIIDISGWYLDDNGGTTFVTISQDIVLYPQSCVVVQKNFNLNKSSADSIRLFNAIAPPTDASAQVVDSYSYSSSPGNGISYQRDPDGSDSWNTDQSSFGFFNKSGNNCLIIPTNTSTPSASPTEIPTQTPTTSPSPSPSPRAQSYDNIYISEVMVAPDSGSLEWVELYNDNDFQVTLSDWYIDDIESGGSSPKKVSVSIGSQMYITIEFSSALFNNSGDDVRLLDFEKNEKDSFTYASSKKGKSWGWSGLKSDAFCLQIQSKSSENNECIPDQTSTTSDSPNTSKLNKELLSNTSENVSSNQSNQSLEVSSASTSYAIPVAPPIVISPSETIDRQVLSATSEIDPPQQISTSLPLLAVGYSLLSIGSLVLKMIYS